MKTILAFETMDIPDGVKIKFHAKIIEVLTGSSFATSRARFGSGKTSPAIRTALSRIGNLITDITKGYRYKMRFVYAYFSINASITNFLGEKNVKDEPILDGNDIEVVSRKFLDGIYVTKKGTMVTVE
ncbi:unnamed protein product [Malus baccata var. baccata]